MMLELIYQSLLLQLLGTMFLWIIRPRREQSYQLDHPTPTGRTCFQAGQVASGDQIGRVWSSIGLFRLGRTARTYRQDDSSPTASRDQLVHLCQ